MGERSKVSIIGAGAVGSAIAYAMLIRESAREIVLYDNNTTKVEAEVLDLAHGTQFTGSSSIDGGSDMAVTSESDVIVVTAGAKQNPGQTRLELASVNASIMQQLLPQLLKLSPDAIVILVTNPCDVLTVKGLQQTGLPASRMFSSGTVLDSSRLRWLLAKKLGVHASSVHAYIVGEHGDSEFSLWSQTRIGPVPILEFAQANGQSLEIADLEEIAEQVRTAAYRVIQGKGATNYAIGLSAARIVEAVLNDENAILPISSLLTDYHGVSGVALSVPTIVNRNGAHRVLEVPMSQAELEKFRNSASAVAASVASLGS